MEIFNNVRSQQAKPQMNGGGVETTRKTESVQKSREVQKEHLEKADEEKLKKELQEIVKELNKEMDPLRTSIRFGFDDKVGELYVSVIDTQKNEVIRKIPSDEALRLAAKMRELVGMLFDKKG